MKFLLSRELTQSKIKNLLLVYLGGLFLFMLSSFYFEFYKVGLFPEQIKNTILGNSSLFVTALPFDELMIFIHVKVFMYLILSLVLIAIFFRSSAPEKIKLNISAVLFGLILVDNISLLLTGLGFPQLAILKSTAFILLQFILIHLVIYNFYKLFQSKKS